MNYFRCMTENAAPVTGELFDSNEYVYNYLGGSNNHPRVIWTYTNSTGRTQKLYMKGVGSTNTGGNEGFFELFVNNVSKEQKTLITGSSTNFEFTPVEIPNGATAKVNCDWINTHTNCNWTIWASVALTHE